MVRRIYPNSKTFEGLGKVEKNGKAICEAHYIVKISADYWKDGDGPIRQFPPHAKGILQVEDADLTDGGLVLNFENGDTLKIRVTDHDPIEQIYTVTNEGTAGLVPAESPDGSN